MPSSANSEDPDEMQHNAAFIRFYTVCLDKSNFQRNTIFLETITSPRYIQWTLQGLLDQTSRENPLVYEGLITHYHL